MFIIYTKERKTKEMATVNMKKEELKKIGMDEWANCPDLDREQHIVVEREIPFNFPIYDGDTVREATKEEKIALDYPYELEDGEKIEEGKLVTVEKPADLYRPTWDRDSEEWREGATSREILLVRKDCLLKAKSIKKEIRDLEEIETWGDDLGEDFDEEDLGSDDTIAMLRAEFDELMKEVSRLTKLYKKLKNQGI